MVFDLVFSGLGHVLLFMSTVLMGLGPYGLSVAGDTGEGPNLCDVLLWPGFNISIARVRGEA